MGEKLDLSMGDALWLVRDEHGLICETWRLPAAWLTHLPPRADYPAGLLRVVPDKDFCADAPRPGMVVMADAGQPTSLVSGFYLDKRDCLVNDGAKQVGPSVTVLELQPDDVLVAALCDDRSMSEADLKALADELRNRLPGRKVLVTQGIQSWTVLRDQKEAAPPAVDVADQPAPVAPPAPPEPPKRGREFI